jgi:hypothetical protein
VLPVERPRQAVDQRHVVYVAIIVGHALHTAAAQPHGRHPPLKFSL